MDSPSPQHQRRDYRNDGDDNSVTTSSDQEQHLDYLDQQASKYLDGISASFNHTDFENNVRHVIRIRRHALKQSGPSKEDYYQSLVENYKRQQQQESEKANLEKLRNGDRNDDDSNSNNSENEQERLRNRLKLIGKNNTQAAEARKRIKDSFGEDYGAAGRALLHGARLPETTQFDDCTTNVTAAGSRATLWARTLKQWRRDKASGLITSEDTRATQAMASVAAKFEQEEMKSKLTGEEVQQWADHLIKEKLCDRTKGIVGRIQSVIKHSRKSERQRIRRDFFKQNRNAEGADEVLLKRETEQRKMQEELFRILSQGGDFTKNMSPELHGLWLRSLLPGQQIGGIGDDDDDDDDFDDKDEEDENPQGKMAPETDFEVMNRVERAKFSEKLVDELPQQQNQNSNNGGNGASSPASPSFSTIRVTRHNSNSNKNNKKSRISDLLARANVDPKMLEVDSIRERAKKVLFGGISCLVTPRSPSSSSCEKNDSSNDDDEENKEENELSRAASSISVFSSTSTKNNNNVNSNKNDSSKHQQHQQHNTTSMSGETFGMNTPAVSEVIGHEDDLHGNRALYSPSKTASTMNFNNESNNNHQLENSRDNTNTSGSLLFNLSKNPNISDALLAGAARRKMERERAKNVNTYNTRNITSDEATMPPPSPSASETSARSTFSDDPDGDHRLKKENYAMSKHTPDFVFGGANLSQVATAKEAREKVMRLLEAEIHDDDDDDHESENNIENGNRNNDPLSSKFQRLKEAAANAKYLKATKHWGDSRHALVWDFEMDQIRESVAREVGRDPSKWRSSPNRNRKNNKNNNLRQNSTGSSAASSSLYHSPKSIESGSTSLSRSDDCCHRQNITASSNMAIDDPVKRSERLQKLERTIHLLETRQIGNFVAKDKFFCRLERNNYAALNNNNNNISDESHPRLPGGENSAVGMDRTASAVNFGQSDKKFRSMHFGGSIIGGGMEDEASFRSNARYAPAADVLASSPKQHNLLLHKQHQQQNQQQDIHSNNMNMNQKPKLVAIPELDHAFGKYHCALDIKLSHLDPATEKPFALRLTNMPEPDLYAYQRYAKEKNMVIIIRPISEVVPQLYATPGLHIKGKSINVSLKSSSYCPIDGLIPVNPALGKAYLDAMRREREIEDMILNATGGVVTVSLLKRLRAQKAAAGSLTQAFRRDIITALERSELELNQIMEEYREKLVVTVDKETISRAYIERFNEAQFLGTTHAQWKGQGIFYREIPGVGVERDPREAPVFYIETHPGVFIHYVPETDSLDDVVATQTEELLPVMVVTHRMFTVSETTKRIEPDPTLFMIGPDFDGLVYARRVELAAAAQDRIEWSLKINHYRLNRTMGLVNEFDIEHVKEVRLLTEWKQNHGYECGNTVKTQPITVAAHAVITPDSFTILTNIFEIVSYIRTAWKHNIPLIVNPNWRAVLDGDLMPRLYGEDLSLPVVDDCGASAAQTRFEVESVVAGGHSYDYVKKVVGGMTARAAQMRKDFRDNRSRGGASSGGGGGGGGGVKLGGTSASSPSSTAHQTQSSGTDEGEATLEEAVKLVVDKKEMSELFYEVRRWQLMPPVFVERNGAAATTQSKLYGNGDERTRWDAPFDDPVVNQEYEKFRKSQVEAFLVEYQKGKQDFLQMHGERSSRAFIDTLDDYLFPEPYPKTI